MLLPLFGSKLFRHKVKKEKKKLDWRNKQKNCISYCGFSKGKTRTGHKQQTTSVGSMSSNSFKSCRNWLKLISISIELVVWFVSIFSSLFEVEQKRKSRRKAKQSKKEKKDDFKETMNMIQCNSCYLNYSKHTLVLGIFLRFFFSFCTVLELWTRLWIESISISNHTIEFFFFKFEAIVLFMKFDNMTHVNVYSEGFQHAYSLSQLICADDDDKNHIYANSFDHVTFLSYRNRTILFFFLEITQKKNMNQSYENV